MATGHTPFGAVERALAWRYVRARREHGGLSLTAILSFAGIALAVFALIVIMSIMAGFRATLLDALLGGQPHIIVSVADKTEVEADRMIESIQAVDGVTSATPYLQNQVLVTRQGGGATGAVVKSISMQELESYTFLEDGGAAAIEAGFGQGRNGGDVILMGAYLASQLGVLPGDQVKLISPETNATPFGGTPRNKTYTVGDLFKTGSVELDRIFIFMPLEQGQIFFQNKGSYQYLDIRLADPMATERAETRIVAALDAPVYMQSWKRLRAQYLNALNIERNMMRIVMLVLVTITALNIISGVIMLVKNKTRDIAILRTIGATRGTMMRVFIMIGGALGLIGALTGMSLGVLFVVNIPNIEWALSKVGVVIFDPETYGLEGLPARLSLAEVIGSAAWAVAVSVVVTLWPAWRGASIDPVEALRFE
ncbi:MAG: lipoprotein-releasing ABC transporter permease subunit [Hyphomonadaceae bacterium]|nr:lipoprotein-releasing ABC transporter permease subunit [Hyphomonadaceae bacterium]